MSSKEQTKAVVVGAGIAGVSTAFELSKNGYDVTVIEKYPLASQFCSMANAGTARDHSATGFKSIGAQYKHAGFFKQAVKSLLPTFKPSYDHHVFIDPYFFTDITSIKWTYFAAKSKLIRTKDQKQLDCYEQYCSNAFKSNLSDIGNIIGHNLLCNTGYGKVFPALSALTNNRENLFSELTQMQMIQLNSKPSPIRHKYTNVDDNESFVQVETTMDAFVGDCHEFSNIIADTIAAKHKIDFMFNTEAKKILIDNNNEVFGVEIDNDTIIKTDKVCICAGVLTSSIVQRKIYQIENENTKRIKLPFVPIVPLQGYSITIPYSPKDKYKYPLNVHIFQPYEVYVSRNNDSILRFASYGYFRSIKYATNKWKEMKNTLKNEQGTQCNVGKTTTFEDILWDNLENCIKDNILYLYDIDEKDFDENKIRWTGFRPYTPDGLPVVGLVSSNIDGLYINAGHGSYGWSSSQGNARLIARLMDNNIDSDEMYILNMLSPNRF